MPQMAPMNWLILFIMFMIYFLILSNLIYFSFLKTLKIKPKNKNSMKNYNKLI